MKRIISFYIILLTIVGCSSSDENDTPSTVAFQRTNLLTNWADNIIIPGYQSFNLSLENLDNAFNNFSTTTNQSNLIELRQAWENAYIAWQRISMFENGPAESLGYRLNINIYPTNTSTIEQNIANGNSNLALPSNRDAKGFPALDYLINGSASSDADIVTRFNNPNERVLLLNYSEAIINDMVTLTENILEQWTNTFRDTFIANDGSSTTAATDLLVNDYIEYYEFFLRRGKVGLPAGVFGNAPSQNLLEGFYKGDISNELCLEALEAVQNFFNGVSSLNGSNGIGLDDYLNTIGAEDNEGNLLSVVINNQFNTVINTIENLNSFQEELTSNTPPTNLLLAVEELNRVIPLIKIDMLSFLNINIDFQDSDGD